LRQHQRLGPPHVHRGDDPGRKHLLRPLHGGDRRPHRDQDLQLAGHHVGREDRVPDADALLRRIPLPVPARRADRGDARRGAFQLAAGGLVLRGRSLPLRHRGGDPLLRLRRLLLLVTQGDRADAQRDPGQAALLAVRHRLPPPLSPHARPRSAGDATPHLHLRGRPGLGGLERGGHGRRRHPGRGNRDLRRQPAPGGPQGTEGGERSLGCLDPGVVHHLASARIQLRNAAGGPEPPTAVGSEAPRGSRREVRMTPPPGTLEIEPTTLPSKGKVGMLTLIAAESAIFVIFVIAYLFYLGKSLSGPTTAILRPPIFFTICLLSSSFTVHLAVAALRRGRGTAFLGWWVLTFTLGALFLIGTGLEWKHLIGEGLTISANLFGTPYYSLVGLHALHVLVGLVLLGAVTVFALLRRVGQAQAEQVDVLSLYWHFVDAVWVVVFTVVYVVGR